MDDKSFAFGTDSNPEHQGVAEFTFEEMTSSSDDSDSDWTRQKTPSKRFRKMGLEQDGRKSKNSSTFIQKVFEMANCRKHSHAIGFSEDGLSLEIRNGSLLGPILSQYFRHSHTASFIRQLNNYGFKTISSPSSGNDRHVFAHPNFKRDDRTLLESITRKAAMREKKKSKADVIKDLQQREVEQRTKMQQLEARHHELLQRTLLLDSENRHLKAMRKSGDVKQHHHTPDNNGNGNGATATHQQHSQSSYHRYDSNPFDFSPRATQRVTTPTPHSFDRISSPFGTNPNSPVFVDTLHHLHHHGHIQMDHLNMDIAMSPIASATPEASTGEVSSLTIDSHHGLEYDAIDHHHLPYHHHHHAHHHAHTSVPQA